MVKVLLVELEWVIDHSRIQYARQPDSFLEGRTVSHDRLLKSHTRHIIVMFPVGEAIRLTGQVVLSKQQSGSH